jgi:flagellar biosynthetic protein FliR
VTVPLVLNFQIVLLLFARILAMMLTAPLLSSAAVPTLARVGLAMFVAAAVFPWVAEAGYPLPDSGVHYFLLILGEVFLGLLMGFFLQLIFAAFQVAGQFFSLQMGFGASQVFDPLAQIEIPLMGQFINIMAMFIFLTVAGFQKLLLVGVMRSFQLVRAYDLVTGREYLFSMLLRSLGKLFQQALVISFPILGTLLLVSVTMGLLAKAAPQMNLLMMGFPVAIGTAFAVLVLAMPFLASAFARIIEGSFDSLLEVLSRLGGGGG